MSQRSTTSSYHQAMEALDPETQLYLRALPAAVRANILKAQVVILAPVAVFDMSATVAGSVNPRERFPLMRQPLVGSYKQIIVAAGRIFLVLLLLNALFLSQSRVQENALLA